MTMRTPHRVICTLFVFMAGLLYFRDYAPVGMRWTYDILVHVLLTGFMFGAWATGRGDVPADRHWTLVTGIVARLLVAPIAVSFNHDVQRYLWDGAVFWAGLDPYRFAPGAPELTQVRALWPTPTEHTAAVTIYPPGAVFLFGLAASLGPPWAPWIWKLFITAASVGTLFVGARLLEERSLSRHLPLIALSPLLVMQTATGATLDVVSAFAVAIGLFLIHRGRLGAAGVALGWGALLKFLPTLAVLPVAVHLGWRRGRRLVAATAITVAAGYVWALLLGLAPLGMLPVFFQKWRFGSPAFGVLATALGDDTALRVAPLILAIVLAAIAFLARRRSWTSLVPFVLAAPLAVSPVVFPWYFTSVVPALALAPTAFLLAWVTALPFTNEVLDRFEATGLWQPAAWPLWTIAMACTIGVGVDLARSRRAHPR